MFDSRFPHSSADIERDELSADEIAELEELIPRLMAPELPELRSLDESKVTIDLLLSRARKCLQEQIIEPAKALDAAEAARRH